MELNKAGVAIGVAPSGAAVAMAPLRAAVSVAPRIAGSSSEAGAVGAAAGGSHLQDLLAEGLARVLGRLPRAAACSLGASGALAVSTLCRRKNVRARANLARAGVADTSRACRRGWTQAGRTAFEIFWMLSRSPDRVVADVSVRGLDTLLDARRDRRGVLLVSAHCGNWETVPVVAARAGLPVSVVARTMRTPRLEQRIIAWRKAAGVATLVRGAAGSSVAAYRTLANGGVLGCMMDRASTGRRVAAPFLGGWTQVPVGPLALAARSGAAIVAGVSRDFGGGRVEVSFRKVAVNDASDFTAVAASVMRVMEDHLWDRPEDWLWIYRRQPAREAIPA